jgi:hypothetical protein
MSGFYVLDVPEFRPLLAAAKRDLRCEVHAVRAGYTFVEFNEPIEIRREATGLKPAVWFGCLTAGLDAKITAFNDDVLGLAPTNEPIL